jgi:hypothetical protein
MEKHILTFDIEDWFQVFYGEAAVKKSDWDQMPSEFSRMIETLSSILESRNLKATFFIVGWLADKFHVS